MNITDIRVIPLTWKKHVYPGDICRISTIGPDGKDELLNYKVDFEMTLSHCVFFRLNGQMQWLVGNEDIVAWITSLAK